MHTPRLMAVLAHPDDESLGVGGVLAKYAAEGVDVFLLTATRGDSGRYRGHRSGDRQHPGPVALAKIREAELHAAPTVWRAISCHESQVAAYERLKDLSPGHHQALWGWQSFYRAFSTVNGGRARETSLFEGISR